MKSEATIQVERQRNLLTNSDHALQPIGILDSGVGGLSVLRHIRAQLPHEDLLYVADQAHVPYGSRPLQEIRQFSAGITRFLLSQGAKVIVVACNAASAAALNTLRRHFPGVPIVGMEPAVKPAAAHTKQGKVGVLATPLTFDSPRYSDLTDRFAQGIELFENPCAGLVGQIEAGLIDTPETEQLLRTFLHPMLAVGIDTLVLGCTHYPFVIPLIEQIVGPAVTIIDPAPAVAHQTKRILQQRSQLAPARAGHVRLFTTAQAPRLAELVPRLLPFSPPVETAVWRGDILTTA